MLLPIMALNPGQPKDSIATVSGWCNDHSFDHYMLLYASAVLSEEGMIYQFSPKIMEGLGMSLYSLPTGKHRFLAVILLLKAMISTYRVNIMWLSEYSFDSPAVPESLLRSLAAACRSRGLSPSGLLDIALCRAGTEELTQGSSQSDQEAALNCDLLVGAAEAGRLVGRELGGQPLEDRVGMLLKLIGVMSGNILGNCGKTGDAAV